MTNLPFAASHMKIGIFGGSFNPPHAGHRLVAERALRRLGLDQLWWVPSHGNPLKANAPAPLDERIGAIESMITDPRMKIVDLETIVQSSFSIDAYSYLMQRHPSTYFVMITGADILVEFHQWSRWQELAERVPICAMARPDYHLRAMSSPFARRYRKQFVSPSSARSLASQRAPAWTLLPGPTLNISSSQIRAGKT